MTGLINQILNAPTWTVLILVALLVFLEDALFVGFVIPGETAAMIGGVTASLGHAPWLPWSRSSSLRRSLATASGTRSGAEWVPGS
jgi:membrane protein DedA with SNARE-associated domain